MEINFVAVLAATVVMFAVGAFWYMVPFSKIWGEMHGFSKLSKEKQKEMQSQMGPYYGLQLLVTLISAFVLAHFIAAQPNVEWYKIASWLWLGFIVPTTVSGVVFGGTEGKYVMRKIVIMIGGSLVCTLTGAWVISLF